MFVVPASHQSSSGHRSHFWGEPADGRSVCFSFLCNSAFKTNKQAKKVKTLLKPVCFFFSFKAVWPSIASPLLNKHGTVYETWYWNEKLFFLFAISSHILRNMCDVK